jgi:uncharacterized protein (TIGR02444 family)
MSQYWDWALSAYARPGVAQACLDLQDEHGQCTPYLLWAAWAAQSGRGLDEAMLVKGADLAHRWEPVFIKPVRAVRRALKPVLDGVADDLREALREQVKAVELAAEKTLMLSLEALALVAPSGSVTVQQALEQATALWAPSAPKNSLMALSQHL